jgi:hypothetical protein
MSVLPLTEDEAQKHFKAAVSWIGRHVSYQFTSALAKSIICELHRENGDDIDSDDYQPSTKKILCRCTTIENV